MQTKAVRDTWHWRYSHSDLKSADLVTNLVESICHQCGLEHERPGLHVVIGEVVSNAIDHGLLKLDSTIKAQPGGFDHYIAERAARLERLTVGTVRVTAELIGHTLLRIAIQDSGDGFDHRRAAIGLVDYNPLHVSGRGLLMVRHLCRSVTHVGCGNCIVVEFDIEPAQVAAG